MRHSAKTILRIVLTLAVILISSHTIAQEQPNGNQAPETKRDVSKSAPDLADIIPLAKNCGFAVPILPSLISTKKMADTTHCGPPFFHVLRYLDIS
jgi:hypothetical protein